MKPMHAAHLLLAAALCTLAGCSHQSQSAPQAAVTPALDVAAQTPVTADQVVRVSAVVPFPRGVELVDGKLYALARGRLRDVGGVDGRIDDKAGTLYVIDPAIYEPARSPTVSPAVRANGKVYAEPTDPPIKLFDRSADPAYKDRETDRPYCSLRYDPATKNFYFCAFSGIDKGPGQGTAFSKNTSDAIFRFDTRTKKFYEVERHALWAGGNYPQHDPYAEPPPHGWLNGPDNCIVVGHWLYCVAKDNSVLIRYDLSRIAADPNAPAPPSQWVMDNNLTVQGLGLQHYYGQSALAVRDNYLYIAYRTSSVIVRIPLDAQGLPIQPITGQLIAQFDPYNEQTGKSANLTDMAFGPDGNLYVISSQPAHLYRIHPDPKHVFDGRSSVTAPWADLATLTGRPKMKSENIFIDPAGKIYFTSSDGYDFQHSATGTVWCLHPHAPGAAPGTGGGQARAD
jgi:hypothetical protein